MHIRIERLTAERFQIIHDLIHQIYYPTYHSILSTEQIDFMLEKSYTVAALQENNHKGEHYDVIWENDLPLGFIATKSKSERILRVEKIYLLPNQQGKGLGQRLIEHAADLARKSGQSILQLNVNRHNKAYYFYLKQGFEVVEEVDIPYYGFELNDYIMQKCI